MGFLFAIVFIGGLVFVSVKVGNARTMARKSANATKRRSLEVRSALASNELSAVMSSSLVRAGTAKVGSFDNKSFFRLSNEIELELTVTAEADGSRARISLPSVRSVSGRPQRLAPVGRALDAAARMIAEYDQSATIN
jgi:hypothetical protein